MDGDPSVESMDLSISQEQKMQPIPQFQPANSYDSYQHRLAIDIIGKLVQRNYSRHFIKKLMFNFIESLKKSQPIVVIAQSAARPTADIKWPFKELYYKRNRTPEENQMFEFVNLCAQMIQSRFKGYITRKRHLIAYKQALKAKDVLLSFVRRWKTYRTYNCEKIVEIRNKIREIQRQIDEEEENFTNRDAKKLKGLYKYLEIYNKMFKQTFNLLMETGMWTLEKNMKPKMQKKPRSPSRLRQFQQEKRQIKRARNQQQNIIKPSKFNNQNKKQNIDQNISNQFISPSYQQGQPQAVFGLQERPIKAAGQYKLNELELAQSYVALKQNKEKLQKEDGDLEPKAKQKVRKAQELKKRTKYDPRKAIQEERNRKKGQLQQKVQVKQGNETKKLQSLKLNNNSKVESDKQTIQNISTITVELKQKPKKSIKQKKPQAKKGTTQTEKSQQEPPTPKQLKVTKKISSKVDCWGSKKEPEPDWVKQYKSRLLENRNDSQQKTGENLRRSIQKNIVQPIKKQDKIKIAIHLEQEPAQKRAEQKRARLKSEQQQQQRINTYQNWKQKQKQIQHLKQKQQQFMGQRKNSSHNLQEQVRAILDKKNNLSQKKKQMHRPIQELEQTYSKHYGDRYQNLMPKLSLLAVARSQERQSKIPIMIGQSQGSGQEDQWFQPIYHSTHYWKIISQHDRIFKSFLLS